MSGIYNDTELAWLAGIVDGEGSVCFSHSNLGKHRTPMLYIASTTLELLQEAKRITGVGTIVSKKTYQPHHKPSWTWSLGRKRALEVMELIQPYVKEPLKQKRIAFLLENYAKHTHRNGKYSEQELQAKLAMEQAFFSLS